MPPRNQQRNASRPATPKREADLSALLTLAQRADLILLVTTTTDIMQQQTTRVFGPPSPDLPALADVENGGKRRSWYLQPALLDMSKIGSSLKENARPGKQTAKTSAGDKTRHLPDKKDEVPDTSQAELKREALAFFKKWQASVLKRVGEISVAPQQTHSPNAKPFSKPGPARQPNRSSGAPNKSGAAGNKPSREGRHRSRTSRAGRRRTLTAAVAKTSVIEADAALKYLYPPTLTALRLLPFEKRTLLLHSMLLLLLSLEHYAAYSRVLLLNMASSLYVPLHLLAEDELRTAKALSQVLRELPTDEEIQKKGEENKTSRRWKGGLANVAITGGLPTPLITAGIGSVSGSISLGTTAAGSLLGFMAENGIVVGTLFGLYGARAAGKMMDSYSKDVLDFPSSPSTAHRKRSLARQRKCPPKIAGSDSSSASAAGFPQQEDSVNPWLALGHQNEVYTLRWELEALAKVGNSLETVVKSATWSVAKKEIIARTSEFSFPTYLAHTTCVYLLNVGTASIDLIGAPWPASLLKISKIVDNPWSVAMVRADKAGTVLADAIMNKIQGERGGHADWIQPRGQGHIHLPDELGRAASIRPG